jgi:hypothetical protein
MSFGCVGSVVDWGVGAFGLAGTSVPAGPRLRGIPRGIGGIATKSQTKGGGATPHACSDPKTASNHNTKKNSKSKNTKETK